jgi:hypothetical protein
MTDLKSYLLIPIIGLTLTGCFKSQTFEERLAGKVGTEREREAYYACIEKSDNAIPGGHSGKNYAGHEHRMRKLCDEMHKTNLTKE